MFFIAAVFAEIPLFRKVQAQSDLNRGLILHYKFDGNAYDSSSSGNNGVIHGVTQANDRWGNPKGCYSFNGNDNYVDSERLIVDVIGSFTQSIWVQTSIFKDHYVLYPTRGSTTWGDDSVGVGLWLSGNRIRVLEHTFGSMSSVVESAGTFSSWTQVIIVYANQVPRLFLNGKLVATGQKSLRVVRPSSGLPKATNSEAGGFGGWSNSSTAFESIPCFQGSINFFQGRIDSFQGNLDDMRIYNRALSNEEVKSLYDYESNGSPRRATATPQLVNGYVVGVTVTDSGFGYETPPAVLLKGGDGSGATAVATVVNGMVTKITMTNPGSGYTSDPVVRIASPPFTPKVGIEISKVNVRLSVVLGRKYQLEASTDLNTWTPTGSPFIAQDEEINQEFDVNQVGRFFRISQVP